VPISPSLITTLVSVLLLLFLFTYLAWFRPDRYRTLGLPPRQIRRFLGSTFEPCWQVRKSDFALWLGRVLGPINIAILLALLIWMLFCEFGFCR
jgi:hypothetical protein